MIKIGLTGGIGSGKSTISKMLVELGYPVIDADTISKEVLKKYPEILLKVKDQFGSGFFDWRGEFRRKEFGNHIFRFPKQRIKYEEIIMPYIKKDIYEAINEYKKKGEKLVILDAPTLIENDLHKEMDYVVLVWLDSNMQVQRVKVRDKLMREDAIARVNSQFSLDRKKEFAHIIIDNSGDIQKTKIQVDGLVKFLKEIS